MALDDRKDKAVSVVFNWGDNQSEAKNAVNVLRRQLLTKPDLYISGVKPQAMAIKDQVTKLGIPNFLWTFDVSVRPNGEKNNFRSWVNFKIESPLFINYANKIAAKRVAIIYVQLPHTDEEYQTLIIPGLKDIGVTDIMVEPYQMDLSDFRSMTLRIKKFNPDLLILSGFPENLSPMIRSLSEQDMLTDGNTVASYDLLDAASLLPSKMIKGIRVSAPLFVTRKNELPTIRDWYAKFEAKYHKAPLYTHAYAYDMANIINEAASRFANPTNKKTMTELIQETSLDGITGKLTFDESGDLPASVEVGVFRDGVAVPDL